VWLKFLATLAALAEAFLQWRQERQAAQVAKAAEKQASSLRQQGVDAQAAHQTQEALNEVVLAQDARLGVEAGLAREPDSLRAADEFERRD
jgi:Flp pilus assembly protein TadB